MKVYKIDDKDKVVVALSELKQNEIIEVQGKKITVKEDIPTGHKMAITDIQKGESILKYGCSIGEALVNICEGAWVHTHNVKSHADEERAISYCFDKDNTIMPGCDNSLTFAGYERKNGETGTRNYIAIMSGVFCANSHIKRLAQIANERFPKTKNFDGFLPLTHECGCGQEGEDLVNVKKIIANLIQNPNFGGVLFVEVGCEITKLDTMKEYLGDFSLDRLRSFTMQDVDDEFEVGIKLAEELYEIVKKDSRSICPVSKLNLGFNCGGSDGFSGLTANKLVGELANDLCSKGATVSITEITEMFGAEHILMNRAINEDVFEDVKELIHRHKEYIEKYGASANGNPSYGNKKGGITTIEDKSLGCVQKGGRCAVVGVAFYGGRIKHRGLNLVQGPGSDLVGVTSQIAAGATMEIFTTGRGTPVAFAAPTLKVATNTKIYEKKPHWMDFNGGRLLEGESMESLLIEFRDFVLKAASGEYETSNERVGFYEIGILRDGVIM